ncbi:gliding motility-associated ABC transporter substrate-binding protein GldG [Neolewinella antarctica]|uniref:Gliding-associated putative ABC transporter substrate-binding component GldG n=1 Tax=Neolewinella antarctica TaxID=442734 RepID=A0ABX0X828_9BACT|nr:gliding motility-associated ABC transporter substrate-binding protein GldG [Neolewinella antarctica]NJC25205.1 gliding-associated putative ABC transporter substrate-binding component GldG [Neolewinella antarctica]
MPQLEQKYRTQSLIQFVLAVVLLVLINVLANARIGGTALYGALDLTEDQRFTLTDNTVEQLEDLEERLTVRILLTGKLPANYERLKEKVADLLLDFNGYTDKIEWEFSDPLSGDIEVVRERQLQLQEDYGIVPVNVYSSTSAAERSLNAVYPYAVLTYGTRQRIIPFLAPRLPGMGEAQRLNQAESLLEYNFSRAIEGLTNNDKPLVGFTVGHGELPKVRTSSLYSSLQEDYDLGPVNLDSFATISTEIKLLIVAKPTVPFSEFDAFKLDQYVMNGGKVIWAIDAVAMDLDSLQGRNEFYPGSRQTGLEDIFFKYGFRLPPTLALDLSSTRISIVVGQGPGGPNIQPVNFPYNVKAIPQGGHPIIKNLDPIDLKFPTVIESVNDADNKVKKTVLLQTSPRSRRKRLPAPIDLDAQKYDVDLDRFNENALPLAYLLEGTFTSYYANRLKRENEDALREGGIDFKAESVPTRMIIVADGDVMSNELSKDYIYHPLGYNIYDKFQYANKTFLLNAIEYLLDPDGVIGARGKEVRLRLTDKEAAVADATYWRLINVGLPLVLLALFGFVFNYLRKRRYAR